MNEKVNNLDEILTKQGFSQCGDGPLTLSELEQYLAANEVFLIEEGYRLRDLYLMVAGNSHPRK